MGSLDGQVAIITGGTRGIGRATAELFAASGAKLALCARDQNALDETAAQIAAKHGTEVVGIAADILDAAAMKAFVDRVGNDFGRIDILVNNAGGSEQRQAAGSRQQVYAVDPPGGAPLPPGRFEEMSDEEFLNAFQQKVLALVRIMRAVLPWMRRNHYGSIVNIVSMKGKQPPPRVVSSGVAAAAAMNLSKALSFELANDGIRVNVVALESIVTSQTEKSRARWAPGQDDGGVPRAAQRAHPAASARHTGGGGARHPLLRRAARRLHHRPGAVRGRRRIAKLVADRSDARVAGGAFRLRSTAIRIAAGRRRLGSQCRRDSSVTFPSQ